MKRESSWILMSVQRIEYVELLSSITTIPFKNTIYLFLKAI